MIKKKQGGHNTIFIIYRYSHRTLTKRQIHPKRPCIKPNITSHYTVYFYIWNTGNQYVGRYKIYWISIVYNEKTTTIYSFWLGEVGLFVLKYQNQQWYLLAVAGRNHGNESRRTQQ